MEGVRGTSKSAVSRRFVAKTEAQMDEWLKRDLSQISLTALMIDGVHVDEHVLLVALGIDVDGDKHVLGVREGATENSTACTELLADLVERNLRTDYTILAAKGFVQSPDLDLSAEAGGDAARRAA
jgi:transposase-like protein